MTSQRLITILTFFQFLIKIFAQTDSNICETHCEFCCRDKVCRDKSTCEGSFSGFVILGIVVGCLAGLILLRYLWKKYMAKRANSPKKDKKSSKKPYKSSSNKKLKESASKSSSKKKKKDDDEEEDVNDGDGDLEKGKRVNFASDEEANEEDAPVRSDNKKMSTKELIKNGSKNDVDPSPKEREESLVGLKKSDTSKAGDPKLDKKKPETKPSTSDNKKATTSSSKADASKKSANTGRETRGNSTSTSSKTRSSSSGGNGKSTSSSNKRPDTKKNTTTNNKGNKI